MKTANLQVADNCLVHAHDIHTRANHVVIRQLQQRIPHVRLARQVLIDRFVLGRLLVDYWGVGHLPDPGVARPFLRKNRRADRGETCGVFVGVFV